MLREVRDRVNCSFASLFHSPHPSLAFFLTIGAGDNENDDDDDHTNMRLT